MSRIVKVYRCVQRSRRRDRRVSDTATGSDFFAVVLMTPVTLMTSLWLAFRACWYTTVCSQSLLQFQKLSHEVEIWTYYRARIFHEFVRLDHRHTLVSHYVRDCYRCASRYTRLTVNQYAATGFSGFLCNNNKYYKKIISFFSNF